MELSEQALRLTLAADLTHRAARSAGPRIPADAGTAALVAAAQALAGFGPGAERAHRVRFEPPYPGVTGGVEELRGGRRLVLACEAIGEDGHTTAVVFTTLIAGRPPQVAVAPALARIPDGWRALEPAGVRAGPWRGSRPTP